MVRYFRYFLYMAYCLLAAGFCLFLVCFIVVVFAGSDAHGWITRLATVGFWMASVGVAGCLIGLQFDIAAMIAARQFGDMVRRLIYGKVWPPGRLALERWAVMRAFILGRRYRLAMFLLPEALLLLWIALLPFLIGHLERSAGPP